VREWGHVRLFSPWKYNTDAAAVAILKRHGWQDPPREVFPTGEDLYQAYLKPLAGTTEMAAIIETKTKVRAISRHSGDKVVTRGRETKPFQLLVAKGDGTARRELARAVIDASGTWSTPNPLGAGGVPAIGEADHADRNIYGIPDVLGKDRAAYERRTTAVIGASHSAANVLLDLARLAKRDPRTSIVWVVRGTSLVRVYGGGRADQLPARGELGADVRDLVESGRITLVPGFSAVAVREHRDGVVLEGETAEGLRRVGPVDRIVVATGQRPDLALTHELRLDLDPWLEAAKALGPVIDPNLHSCGSVPPHGHRELSHPEPGFYTVGVKSYGQAPTFLMMTGYEQVRSVAAAIAGDARAADDVRLLLPETGVCSTQAAPQRRKRRLAAAGRRPRRSMPAAWPMQPPRQPAARGAAADRLTAAEGAPGAPWRARNPAAASSSRRSGSPRFWPGERRIIFPPSSRSQCRPTGGGR
jgi:thioredoxin reductase